MKTYTYNELFQIAEVIEDLILKSRSDKYHRNLLYGLQKNLKLIESKLDEVAKKTKKDVDGYINYQDSIKDLARACGAVEDTKDGQRFLNLQVAGFNKDKFEEGKKELDEEYEDVLKKQLEIEKENYSVRMQSAGEVDWYQVALEYFPEHVTLDEMPYILTDLIKD